MYAIPVLLALATLIALVYLPRIRKPALWLGLSLVALAALGGSGVWIYGRIQDRKAEKAREYDLSLMVDHAVGKPPNCKSKPFTARYDAFLGDPLKRAQKRATNTLPSTDLDRAIAAGGRPVPPVQPSPGKVAADDFIPDGPVKHQRDRDKQPARKAKGDSVVVPSARKDSLTDKEIDALEASQFDPEAYLCEHEVADLSSFIKDNSVALNGFIQDHQSDPRVDALQTALEENGIDFQKTCKNLVDQKLDEYELHQHGCK